METAIAVEPRRTDRADALVWALPPLVVFLLGLVVTAFLWRVEVREADELAHTIATARVKKATAAIQNQMKAYEQVLRGGTSLIATVGNVTRQQWHDYVTHLTVQETYPGFQGIGYAEHVSAAGKAAFVQRQRQQGLAHYDIRPPGVRETHAPVTYLEPLNERNLKAHGFDMWTEPTRRAAMEAARDTGEPAITGKLKLASEATGSDSFGFLLYMPVYRHGTTPATVAERRARLQGFVNSPFRMADLLQGTLGDTPTGMHLRVHDGVQPTAENEMYRSPALPNGGGAAPLLHTTTLDVHGRPWSLVFEFSPREVRWDQSPEKLVPLAGGLISALMGGLAWAAMARLRFIRRSERHYHALANFDALTAVANRARFQDELEVSVEAFARSGRAFALLFIDLDHFKDVNDTLGHQWGDKLLQQVAQRLKACTRSTDTVARLGGDEFTILLHNLADRDSAARVAQAVLDALAKPYQLEGEPCFVSASVGITLFPQDAAISADLLIAADQAMYAAKRLGRNRYEFYSPQLLEGNQQRLRMISDLRGALAQREFRVVYQPIVDMATGSVCKAEALVRWDSPKHGPVSPAQFIPLAEETGLIVELGDWVFQEAIRQVADWRRRFRPDFQVSVNVSPAQLKRPSGDLRHWIAALQAMDLPGQAVGLEITEGLLLDINEGVTQQLLNLRDAGIPVALDDFGTGYSSLSYLRKLDIDYLKIDQSFVGTLKPDSDELALCAAIIVMAHKLGLKVVAEGVETPEQNALLLAAGCDFGQGYLYSRPVKPEDFEALF